MNKEIIIQALYVWLIAIFIALGTTAIVGGIAIMVFQQQFVLPMPRRRCTEREMFFSQNSPTLMRAGDSLLKSGKYLCNTN